MTAGVHCLAAAGIIGTSPQTISRGQPFAFHNLLFKAALHIVHVGHSSAQPCKFHPAQPELTKVQLLWAGGCPKDASRKTNAVHVLCKAARMGMPSPCATDSKTADGID